MTPKADETATRPNIFRDSPSVAADAVACRICGGLAISGVGTGVGVCESCLFRLPVEPVEPGIFSLDEERQPTAWNVPKLGPYLLLEEIARGGQGVVYRALDQETSEVVAVKTLHAQDAGSPEVLTRFQQEAAASQRLDHPHIMPVREVGCSADGTPFFSMKLALGGNLHQLGAKYCGRWRQIAELLVKISEAIQHAHERGILHRDLKPGNILFTEEHEPLVTDFGLAKHLTGSNDLTQSCTILGTPNYVSPEQAAGKTRDLTTASDIYSLGTIMFELLTGRPPFVGDNALDVLRQVAEQRPPKPRYLVPLVPKPLEAICMRCLERASGDRYASAHDLANDLENWLHGREIATRQVRLRLRSALRRNPLVYKWYCAIAALAAVAWMAWLVVDWAASNSGVPATVAVAIDDLDQDPYIKLLAERATAALKREISKTPMLKLQDAGISKPELPTGILDPVAYGRACNAEWVLTGFIRRTGGQVRLVTRLIRCDTEDVIWREVAEIRSERADSTLLTVAASIIESLEKRWRSNSRSFVAGSRYAPSPAAQISYNRGKELAARTNQRDLEAAADFFQQAAREDSHFAAAQAMLAFAFWIQADAYGEVDKLPSAMSAARRAITIDPNCAQAHRVVASCYFNEARYKEALEEFWNAFELNPQAAGCCQSLGICLREMGHPLEALTWLKRADRLDQTHGAFSATLAESLGLCGNDREAQAAVSRAIDLDGNQPDFQIVQSALWTWQKEFGEARRLSMTLRLRFPDRRFCLNLPAWIELCDGNDRDAEIYFEKLRATNSYRHDWEFYGAINPSSALAYIAKRASFPQKAHLLAEEALQTDRELLTKYPHNARILHDLAATFSTIGDTEHALDYLRESVLAGWAEARSTNIDPRFSAISRLPGFQNLLHDLDGTTPCYVSR